MGQKQGAQEGGGHRQPSCPRVTTHLRRGWGLRSPTSSEGCWSRPKIWAPPPLWESKFQLYAAVSDYTFWISSALWTSGLFFFVWSGDLLNASVKSDLIFMPLSDFPQK